MQNRQLKGKGIYKPGIVDVDVSVMLFEEDNIRYAYLPSFDLTGYGNNTEEAKESLGTVLDEFIRYTLNKNTFFDELRRLGWTLKRKNKPFRAPKMSELLKENEQLKEIIDSKQFSSINYPVHIPAFA